MKKKFILILILALTLSGMGFAIYKLNKKVTEKQKEISDLELATLNSNAKFLKIKKTRDSLAFVNAFLAKYRVLTEAMTYRDSMRIFLKYKVGDIVRLKRDSSRAVINDIIIGGGKHEYYIKYKIALKTGQTEDIVQELLY
ncbi:MAG: hypothetical protein HGB12_01595 [Bacteroidetes bacterium]|nr:hypothetical protein [Bacteroidota bacterium]